MLINEPLTYTLSIQTTEGQSEGNNEEHILL